MKRLRSILAALALTGCTCTTPRTDDVGIDTSAPDAGVDAPIPDARFVLPDVPVHAPLCGPINATTCPIQSAATVSACASGEGAVFFDGAHCQETPSLACGAERGAFGSFEECAVVCAAMYCDASNGYRMGSMRRVSPLQHMRSGVEPVPLSPVGGVQRHTSSLLGVLPPRLAAAIRHAVGVRHPWSMRMRLCR
jgi:hypothetical protein